MQTILGANGQIAEELARELKRNYTADIRLVNRKPKKVNDSETLFAANLLDKERLMKQLRAAMLLILPSGFRWIAKCGAAISLDHAECDRGL